jgi:lysyl endopeptidase
MRRTAGFIIGGCTAVALVGASAYAWAGTEAPAPATVVSGVLPADPVAPPGVTTGPQVIGTLQAATGFLGYAGGPSRRTFSHPDASYLKVHFDRILLLPGDYLTVSDPSGRESYRYDAPALGPDLLRQVLAGDVTAPVTGRWAMSVTGDTAVVELHRTATDLLGLGGLVGRLGVHVDQVARGFSPAEQAAADARRRDAAENAPAGPGREESVCGGDQKVDAACYRSADPVAYMHSRAVARLLINGVELCTGWRISAKDRMLTNNHCFDNSRDAYDTEVWFNYACAVCGGRAVLRPTKVWGDTVLATDRTYDYTLFTVDGFRLIQPFGYLTLDLRRPRRREQLYIPQHPAGRPTEIAGARGELAGNCAVVNNAYNGYAPGSDISYYCDTEGGSSGSPVLSRVTNKVIALHHFGGCPNSGVRADLLYAKIKGLL